MRLCLRRLRLCLCRWRKVTPKSPDFGVREVDWSAKSGDFAYKHHMTSDIFKIPLHTPAHLFREDSIYMITASTYQQQVFIESDKRKDQWRNAFFKACELYQWHIIAWVVLDNHYHVILKSPERSATNLPKLIASLHKFTARQWNDEDKKPGRK